MLTYQVESWNALIQDGEELFKKHWEEIDKGTNPEPCFNHPQYLNLEKAGSLLVVTIRNEDKLIGYTVNFLMPTLKYSQVLYSFVDFFYILPEYRKGFTGIKLFKELEKELKLRGVTRSYLGTRVDLDLGPVFKRLKYSLLEHIYIKDLL